MAHFKRGRAKHLRMGCGCKYWKDERWAKAKRPPPSEQRRLQEAENLSMEEAREAVEDDGRDLSYGAISQT